MCSSSEPSPPSGRGLAPGWYPRLRLPLTLVVVACLILGALS